MFIYSMKVDKNLLKNIVRAIFVILIALVLWKIVLPFFGFGGSGIEATMANKINYNKIKTNEDRVNFIQQFGWEVETSAVEVMEVIIPKTFDSVYTSYNNLQKDQGLDLEKYKGKRVKRWSYKVTNYPGEEGDVVANLLIYNNKVIACDICSSKMDGFMHGMQKS